MTRLQNQDTVWCFSARPLNGICHVTVYRRCEPNWRSVGYSPWTQSMIFTLN